MMMMLRKVIVVVELVDLRFRVCYFDLISDQLFRDLFGNVFWSFNDLEISKSLIHIPIMNLFSSQLRTFTESSEELILVSHFHYFNSPRLRCDVAHFCGGAAVAKELSRTEDTAKNIANLVTFSQCFGCWWWWWRRRCGELNWTCRWLKWSFRFRFVAGGDCAAAAADGAPTKNQPATGRWQYKCYVREACTFVHFGYTTGRPINWSDRTEGVK